MMKVTTTSSRPDVRVCLYHSTAQIAQSGNRQAMSTASLAAIAATKGWKIVSTYSDWGSGLGHKPGLMALLDAAHRAEFDVVMVRDFSRFGRTNLGVLRVMQSLSDANVKLWTPGKTLIGDMPAMLTAMMREADRIRRGRLISEGRKRAAAAHLTAYLSNRKDKL